MQSGLQTFRHGTGRAFGERSDGGVALGEAYGAERGPRSGEAISVGVESQAANRQQGGGIGISEHDPPGSASPDLPRVGWGNGLLWAGLPELAQKKRHRAKENATLPRQRQTPLAQSQPTDIRWKLGLIAATIGSVACRQKMTRSLYK